jgi:hypothetical protein
MTTRAITMLSLGLLHAACTAAPPQSAQTPAAAVAIPAAAPIPSPSGNPALADAARADLLKAVTCEGGPLDIVRGLSDQGSANFASGIATATLSSAEMPVEVIVLEQPLVFHEARAHVVIGDVDGQTLLLPGAAVFASFDGDYRKVVAALGLQPDAPGGAWDGVEFTDAAAKARAAKGDEVCPATILLTPVDDTRFTLGCGWCNG